MQKVIEKKPETVNWVDGIAVHFYGDIVTPAEVLDVVTRHHSNKFILATEACAGKTAFWILKCTYRAWDGMLLPLTLFLLDSLYP